MYAHGMSRVAEVAVPADVVAFEIRPVSESGP